MTAHRLLPHRGSIAFRLLAVLPVALLVAACTTTGTGAATAPAAPSASASGSEPAVAGYPAGCPTSQPDPLGKDQKRVVTAKTDKGDIAMEIDGALVADRRRQLRRARRLRLLRRRRVPSGGARAS